MRAVNLIPADSKPTPAGRSGGGVYVLLGGLALLVVLVGAVVAANNTAAQRKSELAGVEARAAQAEARATALAPYMRFTQMREARVQTVSSLVASRFDWSSVFHEISRVIPSDAWLTGMKGTVGEGGTGAAVAAPAGLTPKIEVTGCTTGHKSVARMMVRMRLMDRVSKVSLTSSNRSPGTSGSAAAAAATSPTGCVAKKGKRAASFAVTVVFAPVGATAAADPAQTPVSGGTK